MADPPTTELEASPSHWASDQTETTSQARQSPSLKNPTDEYGLPYVSELPLHERGRIELETRKNKKPGN